jgi:hypothetical protein
MRRGPEKLRTAVGDNAESASLSKRAKSSAPRACSRAGISSENNSQKNAATTPPA